MDFGNIGVILSQTAPHKLVALRLLYTVMPITKFLKNLRVVGFLGAGHIHTKYRVSYAQQ